ncbi:MAG: hypothetical protein WDN00_11805 [Limisphaerales bacterium]
MAPKRIRSQYFHAGIGGGEDIAGIGAAATNKSSGGIGHQYRHEGQSPLIIIGAGLGHGRDRRRFIRLETK